MSFRLRLSLLFVATLVAVQIFTALLIYGVARRAFIAEGERQLGAGATAVVRQLDDISTRVADNVQVLALDYALRAAIAQHDQSTVLSALRNHGRRIGAERMLLIGLDGAIRSDTSRTVAEGQKFPFPDLADAALDRPSAAVVTMDGKAYWMIVVPVYAPEPIALIAAGIPVDSSLLARLQQLSALPNTIELVTNAGNARWIDVARGSESVDLAAALTAAGHSLPLQPTLVRAGGREYVALAKRLRESQQSAPVAVMLGYSLDDALQPYRSVALAWASLLALGLAAGLVGAMLIARSVAQPIEALAATVHRVESGDYSAPQPMRGDGEIGQLAAAFTNMTHAIAEREEQIRHQALHDAVTGLPNRQAAETAIREALNSVQNAGGALLMIGLARLPEIIQTMGHSICDRVMNDAGARLRQFAARGFVARATDAQFSVWLGGTGKADAIAMAFRILDALGVPYQESDLSIDTAPAIGIALCPQHGGEASALLRRAEVALIAALDSADPVAVYDPTTDPHRPERLTLMTDLREALDGNELRLHYQPKLNLAERRIDSVEALVRWNHPQRGSVPPETFIALAEKTGNIRRLTRWVLASSIAQAQEWAARGHVLRVAVNLSARDLDDAELPRRIGDLLSLHGVSPHSIVLELTESAVMGEPEVAVQVLKRLADMGIDLAIDDFGVGQSSFAYLRRLPVREIKIDRLFTQRLAEDASDRTLVRSIVELGHRLGYRVTAEGVETRAAIEYLRDVGCDHAQGFYVARALAADAVERLFPRTEWDLTRAVALAMLACAGVMRIAIAQDFSAHGYLDCRLIARADEQSWTDGGLGKNRFGSGGASATCVQADVVATAQLTPSLLALADVQYQTTDHNSFSALEAYLRYRPVSTTPLRWSFKVGEFFMPVSLENDALGWTSPWTITPSAINSWIGEEFRTIGAEARVEWRAAGQTFEGIVGLVRDNDPAGELLAARGWSLSDMTSGIGSRVREPDVYATDNGAPIPLRFNPFLENDGRTGWYAGGSWRAPARGGVTVLRYDNEADPTTHSGGATPVYSWHTEFWSLGAEADAGDVVLLAQAMTGSTEIVPSPFFNTTTDFRAAYLLAGWNRGSVRPAIRVDVFSTDQLPQSIENRTREHGNAITFALNWRPRDWLRLTGEALRVYSWRNQRIEEGIAPQQTDTQVQVSARLLF